MNLEDRINPVLLRNIRQSVRGKEFRILYLCLLVGGLALVIISLQNKNSGFTIVSAIGIGLTVLFTLFLPIRTSQSIISENKSNIQDLVTITNLKPSKILMGKFWSMMIIGVVSTSALAPFIVTAYFIGGIPFYVVLLFTAGPIIIGPFFISFALAVSTGLEFKLSQSLGQILLFLSGIIAIGDIITFSLSLFEYSDVSISDLYSILSMSGIYVFLIIDFLLVARSRLLPPQSNRSKAVKISWFITLIAFIATGIIVSHIKKYFSSAESDQGIMNLILFFIFSVGVLSFFFITEDSTASMRVLRETRKNRFQILWTSVFGPGAGRGAIYTFFCFTTVFLLSWFFLLNHVRQFSSQFIVPLILLTSYIFFFLGFPVAIINSFSRFRVTPLLKRLAIIIFFLTTILLSFAGEIILPRLQSILVVLNPFLMFDIIDNNNQTQVHMGCIIALGTVGLLSFIYIILNSHLREQVIIREIQNQKTYMEKSGTI